MAASLRPYTCCFTGHRRILTGDIGTLPRRLEEEIRSRIREGFRVFAAGGARGFDTLAAETVLHLREEYPHIQLVLILPCRDQTRDWPEEAVQQYETILARADEIIYTAEVYTTGCMLKRNRRLVAESAACIAYLRQPQGGTAYTVRRARDQGLRVIII